MSDLKFQLIVGAWHFQLTNRYRIRIGKNKHYPKFKDEVSFIRWST